MKYFEKMTNRVCILLFALIAVASAGIVSCSSVRMNTPQGFAHFDKEREYKAVSSDNVYIRSYQPAEEGINTDTPVATWVTDINRSLLSKGYVLSSTKELKSVKGEPGVFSEYSVIFNGEEWVYVFYVIKKDKTILITEITGAAKFYNERKNEIVNAVVTVDIR